MLSFFIWLLSDAIESSTEPKIKSEKPKIKSEKPRLKCEHGRIQLNCYGCEINSRYKADKEHV